MVIDHGPEFGPSLYLGSHAARIEGMSEAEGRALIDVLMAFATEERFVYAHKWQPHDLILWDIRPIINRATPFESAPAQRTMVRPTIAREPPTLNAAARNLKPTPSWSSPARVAACVQTACAPIRKAS